MENLVMAKIGRVVSDLKPRPESLIQYHGSKSGIKGPIAPISRDRCDFGKGFYMGTDPYQPLTLISDFEHSRFNVIWLELEGLRVLQVSPDIEWAMLDAPYNKLQWMGEEYLLDELKDETGLHSTGEKYSPEVLYWIGYLYRYWACSRNEKSKRIYRCGPAKTMKRNYMAFHEITIFCVNQRKPL